MFFDAEILVEEVLEKVSESSVNYNKTLFIYQEIPLNDSQLPLKQSETPLNDPELPLKQSEMPSNHPDTLFKFDRQHLPVNL